MRLLCLAGVLCSLVAPMAWGFPENVRHGYISCAACHVAPVGGGVLTPYGRSLSAELMSTWGTPKTAGLFFTDNENERLNPPWARANLFLRGVQTRRENSRAEVVKFIPMQADLEAGADVESFAVVGAVGLRARERSSAQLDEVFSRRHYFLYRMNERWTARVGKFMFGFGLNGPDHIAATRRGLGWDQGNESYNGELSYQGERAVAHFTLISDSPSERGQLKDRGVAVAPNFLVGEHSKVGLSLYYGDQERSDRLVYGPSWVLSFTEKLFLSSEVFGQTKRTKGTSQSQSGYATFHRLHYQFAKGVTPFVQYDRSDLDPSVASARFESYGAGIRWLPYPHLELTGFAGQERPATQDPTDFAWLMMFLYL